LEVILAPLVISFPPKDITIKNYTIFSSFVSILKKIILMVCRAKLMEIRNITNIGNNLE